MVKKKINHIQYLIAVLMFFSYQSQAQSDAIAEMFTQLANTRSVEEQMNLNMILLDSFEVYLQTPQSFEKASLGVKFVSELKSDDRLLKIYTWNIPQENGSYIFFGFVQHKKSKKQENIDVFRLIDFSDSIANPKKATLKSENWFGAQYYDLVMRKSNGKKIYTLLGWDGNNLFTNKKIVEILTFSSSGKPKFGASVFKIPRLRYKRLIFEYTQQASMLLHYDKKLEMIVYDHLSPSDPTLKGKYEFYGPDFSQDAFEFVKGKWVYTPNINAQNREKNQKNNSVKYSY